MSTQYHIYGNDGAGGPIDYTTVVATVAGLSWAAPALTPGGDYRFGVRAFDTVSGLEEANADAAVEIVLDSAGRDVTNRPRPPLHLTATAGPGGTVRVGWAYPLSAVRAAWKPSAFHVYRGASDGSAPSYATPAATVPYAPTGLFSATLAGLTPGATYQVGVRAANAAAEEPNTTTVTIALAAAGPGPVLDLAATLE